MQLRVGDMWSVWKQADLFLITANSTVTGAGKLVMGRGIAKQARDRFPGLDETLGQAVLANTRTQLTPEGAFAMYYGLLISERWPTAKLGLLQVKYRWDCPAVLELIQQSINELNFWLLDKPDAEVHLNFPGIGNGKLNRDFVLPVVRQLPDNVFVWELPA